MDGWVSGGIRSDFPRLFAPLSSSRRSGSGRFLCRSRSAPLHAAMARRCHVCGAEYLGNRQCARPTCIRNGARQRDLFEPLAEARGRVFEWPPPAAPAQAEPEFEPPTGTAVDWRVIRDAARLLRLMLEGWRRTNGEPPNDEELLDDLLAVVRILDLERQARRRNQGR